MEDGFKLAGKSYRSRLIVGTGKYKDFHETKKAIEASGAEIVTVAIRRLDLDDPSQKTILDYIDWTKVNILPNTAGCATMEEALFVARLGREVAKTDFVKLEVIPDPRYLFPDPAATLETAKQLVAEGFIVLPYIHADPVLAKNLEEVGCATVMPLGSAIGSGQGIHTVEEIRIIIEQATVPVVVDAGLAVPSDASKALELGADAVLVPEEPFSLEKLYARLRKRHEELGKLFSIVVVAEGAFPIGGEPLFKQTRGGEKRLGGMAEVVAREIGEREGLDAVLAGEAQRLDGVRARLNRLRVARATAGLVALGAEILDAYDRRKQARALLDYDDLILAARNLLEGAGA
ncbi:MAG: 6-phosphofructokinase, partial [Deltaproteobacteria bacterium]|nr:6-phosphofructokinase [Deltaproteobacteria bacterium]